MNKLTKNIHSAAALITGLIILLAVYKVGQWIALEQKGLAADYALLKMNGDHLSESAIELHTLIDLRSRDLQKIKDGLLDTAKSKKMFYESGLSMQEEKRLFEKQYEMLSTYLKIDEQGQKISLMRGEQALQDFPFAYPNITVCGGETKTMPSLAQIVSKERFAHPERGRVEDSSGTIKWIPPQVGLSMRSNALGEYVMFASGGLILHGPPKKKAEHESFPHLCLGLPQRTAQKLYARSYIGTKILFKSTSASSQKSNVSIPAKK